jgi:enoyl-CoA hydratase
MEMMVEGTGLAFEQAQQIGLVNKVWSTDTLEGFARRVMDYAHEFCPPNKASLAVGRLKRAVQSGADMALDHGLALERELQAELFATQDSKEGLIAFSAKRKASFRAR